MKLIVLRHAKSSWKSPATYDHDRPLAPRGIRSSKIIAEWLVREGHQPAVVFCSTATRTRQTWETMQPHLREPIDVQFIRDLYHARANQIWQIVKTCSLSPLMVIGHNPSIGEFAAKAIADRPTHRDFDRYPTAAISVCKFPVDSWQDIQTGTGTLQGFTVPRDHG